MYVQIEKWVTVVANLVANFANWLPAGLTTTCRVRASRKRAPRASKVVVYQLPEVMPRPNLLPLLIGLVDLLVLSKTALSFSIEGQTATTSLPKGFTGVRISLYPKVKESQSLKQTIKDAVSGISDLGLEVRPDDVSSALLGPEPALFEAARAIFGRACRAEGEPHVSMICTFSAGCPGEPDNAPMPQRAVSGGEDEWIDDAKILPARVACQFAVYPLGSKDYMSTIYAVIEEAKKSPSYKDDKSHFCTTLDGDGIEVFDVLRSSFALARKKHKESGGGEHVTMTATLTANKNAWKQ